MLRRLCAFPAVVAALGCGCVTSISVFAAGEADPLAPVSRGPYLQLATPRSMAILWRTDWKRIEPVVRYGVALDKLDLTVSRSDIMVKASLGKDEDTDPRVVALRTPANKRLPGLQGAPAGTFQYEARLTGLSPNTTYYYAVFDGDQRLTPADASYRFTTYPPRGEKRPVRFWATGDSGTGRKPQYAVHEAAEKFAAEDKRPFDFFMHVGDIAYLAGTEQQFHTRFFKPYAELLRNRVCWPTMSNHDGASAASSTGLGPYFNAFLLPAYGEAGGVASGMEAMYSFDWGRVHFISIDSYGLSRKTNGVMARWLKRDMADAKAERKTDWILAFFHHPAYTKGSHDGSKEKEILELRQWIEPILEEGGVDVVLNGHSHTYERTMLIDGSYGTNQVSDHFVLDDGDGDPAGDGPYRKSAGIQPHEGCVVCVTGHGGMTMGRVGSLSMAKQIVTEYGSTVVDIDNDTLTATMINEQGEKKDCFQIVKRGKVTPVRLAVPWLPAEWTTNAAKADDKKDAKKDEKKDQAADPKKDEGKSGKKPEPKKDEKKPEEKKDDKAGKGKEKRHFPDALAELPVNQRVIIPPNAEWQYLAGTHPRGSDWKWPEFEAKDWKIGKAAFGYRYTNHVMTPLSNMRSNYSVVYLRKEFVIDRADRVTELGLMIDYDDAFIAWLNGREVARKGVERSSGRRAQKVGAHDATNHIYQVLSGTDKWLRNGTNVLAIEGHNNALESSDFLLDPYLVSEE